MSQQNESFKTAAIAEIVHLPLVSCEVVDRHLYVLVAEQALDFLVGQVKVKCVRAIEVVVLSVRMIFVPIKVKIAR